MNDAEIIKIFFKNKNYYNRNFTREKWLNNHFEIHKYLLNRFKDSESISETIWRIKLGIEIRPVCKTCGKPVKYTSNGIYKEHCCKSCSKKDPNVNIKYKNTCLEKYGVDSYSKTNEYKEKKNNTCIEKYGNPNFVNIEKIKNTCIEKYGVDNPMKLSTNLDKRKKTCLQKYGYEYFSQSALWKNLVENTCIEKYGVNWISKDKSIYQKIINTNLKKYGESSYFKTSFFKNELNNILEKRKNTNINKYGVDEVFKSDEIKDKIKNSILLKYGVDNIVKSKYYKDKFNENIDQFLKKSYNTKKKNNSFNKSKKEDELYNILLKEYPDTIRQYKSDLYPFACDFYIPSLDLYIEYNGTWTHGGRPFDPINIDDIEKLNKWKEKSKNSKFYKNAIYTWTDLDVRKRNTAKENNLNYLEIWN